MGWSRLSSKAFLFLVLATFIPTGCATFINGSRQPITFMSEPPGATVAVGKDFVEKTPVALRLKRGKNYLITFKKDGYEPQEIIIKSKFSHWVQTSLGNMWNYIVPGLIVDITFGGAYEFNQLLVNCKLVQTKTVNQEKTPEQKVLPSP